MSRVWNTLGRSRPATVLVGGLVGGLVGHQMFEMMAPPEALSVSARTLPTWMRSYHERYRHFTSSTGAGMGQRDFVRALLGASKRDHKNPHAPVHINVDCAKDIFETIDTDGDGYISPDEWELFMVLANANMDKCKILFKMFDFDNSGTVDIDELDAVVRVLLADADARVGELNFKKGLLRKLSRATTKGSLGFEGFEAFVRTLHHAIDDIEWAQYDQNGNGKVNAPEFAHLVANSIAGTYLSDEVVKRLSTMKHEGSDELVIDYWRTFSRLMHNSGDLEELIRLFTASGYPLKKDDFKRAVFTATGRRVSDLEADIVYHVFDRDGDGVLEYDEFMEVMKAQRVSGGIQKRRVSGQV